MKRIQVIGTVCVGLVLAWPALGKDKPARTPKGEELQMPRQIVVQEQARSKQDWVNVKVAFSDHERTVIREHAQHYDRHGDNDDQGESKSKRKGKGLPPGLAKKEARGRELPPGWHKKCVVGEVMPVEVYEKCKPLPPELVVKLPPPPPDTITITVEGKVVRLIKATREILDVFDVGIHL